MTQQKNNNPSINPADNYSLVGVIKVAFEKMMQSINGMMPAQIISYDRTTNRAKVQILITILTTDDNQVPRPVIASVPVLLLGGGNYFISFPINKGDFGWILANDRDISLFLQNYSQSKPNTLRVKNFSDGLFIPDLMRNYEINDEDENNLVIQNRDGSTKITLNSNQININAPLRVNITCPEVVVNPDFPGALFAVNGNITALGTILPSTAPPLPIPPG